jgi:hypothetical protein
LLFQVSRNAEVFYPIITSLFKVPFYSYIFLIHTAISNAGSGISNFKITGIDSSFGSTEETAFPIQLAFNDRIGSFKMRPFSQENSPQPVSESTSALGLLALSVWGIVKALKIRFEK